MRWSPDRGTQLIPEDRTANESQQSGEGLRYSAMAGAAALMLSIFPAIGTTSVLSAPLAHPVTVAGDATGVGGFPVHIRLSAGATREIATAAAIRGLRERSGLTWDELARLFGVSRRAIHAWATGARLNQFHAERLGMLATQIERIQEASPSAIRAALYAPVGDAGSMYQRLLAELESPSRHREGFTVAERLGGSSAV